MAKLQRLNGRKLDRLAEVRPAAGIFDPWPGDWYTVAGKTIIAAYQPKSAPSQADAKINIANPGTYDISTVSGTEPAWDKDIGFTGDVTGGYILTGIAGDAVKTTIISLDNINRAGSFRVPVGAFDTVGGNRRNHMTIGTTTTLYGYEDSISIADTSTSGVYCISTTNAYKNGVDIGDIPSGVGLPTSDFGLLMLNYSTPFYFIGDVIAVALYSDELTPSEISALTTRMPT